MNKTRLSFGLIALFAFIGISSANATDTTTSTVDTSISCAQGGQCQLGDIGPGGGIVFYVRTEAMVAVWKATPNAEGDFVYSSSGWKYLEAAPKTWAGGKSDPTMNWCNNTNVRASWTKELQGRDWYYKWVAGKTLTGFLASTGFGNTEIISKNCKTGAAATVRKYRGGGKSDWYLPRKTELNQLAMFAGGILEPKSACCIKDFPKKQSASFAASKYSVNWGRVYWLSSFSFSKLATQWQGEDRMSLGSNAPSSDMPFVRPIRAF